MSSIPGHCDYLITYKDSNIEFLSDVKDDDFIDTESIVAYLTSLNIDPNFVNIITDIDQRQYTRDLGTTWIDIENRKIKENTTELGESLDNLSGEQIYIKKRHTVDEGFKATLAIRTGGFVHFAPITIHIYNFLKNINDEWAP